MSVSLVQAAISKGFGMHLTDIIATQPLNVIPIALFGQVALSIAVLAINFSKISFAVTLLRLTTGWWRRFCKQLVELHFPSPLLALGRKSCLKASKGVPSLGEERETPVELLNTIQYISSIC